MSQETVVRIRHDPEPLLPVAGFMQACIGGGTPGVRANEGVDKGESCMNSYEFAQNSHEFRGPGETKIRRRRHRTPRPSPVARLP